jgi:prevent-host-death family protein
MVANSNLPQELGDATKEKKPLPFAQNLLGIEFLSETGRRTSLWSISKTRAGKTPSAMEVAMASTQVNLYEAKTHLSSLVDRVSRGEEIVIAKAGKPMARLVALVPEPKLQRKSGQNLLGITYIAEDFDAPLPEDVLQDFGL